MAKHSLSGRIHRGDMPCFVDGDDCVFDVIEDGLQLAGCAFTQLACQRGRLVRHELHRTHDAAPFVISLRVGGFDGRQEPDEVELALGTTRVPDLLVEQSMHLFLIPACRRARASTCAYENAMTRALLDGS